MEDYTKQKTLTILHAEVASYKMPQRAKDLIGSGEVTVLCGVTAAGKNKIIDYLVSHDNYQHVTSHTTRLPRENHGVLEINGKEYWFMNPEEMLSLVKNQGFIEVKAVHGETCYGTSIMAVEKVIMAGKHPVMEIDVQGALELTKAAPKLRPLFILPPSYEVWMERLGMRGRISDGDKARRFFSASMELQTALDHKAFIFVVNQEVEITASEIMRGLDISESGQVENRKLAKELLESIKKT
jgi:guanylate kinase